MGKVKVKGMLVLRTALCRHNF